MRLNEVCVHLDSEYQFGAKEQSSNFAGQEHSSTRVALQQRPLPFHPLASSTLSEISQYLQPIAAIIPLRTLIQRFVPDPSYLTALHPQFILVSLSRTPHLLS